MFSIHVCKLITIARLLLAVITDAQGRLTEKPENNVVLQGATTEFACCSDIKETIFWKIMSVGSQSKVDIYDFSGLLNGFRESNRFSVTAGRRPGCYKLNITDVKMEDAGTYTCVENEGFGIESSWELVILESFDCQEITRKAEYMGENDFGIPLDAIAARCISKYFGNVPPKPVCEWSSGNTLHDIHHHVTEINRTTTLNIQLPATKDLNGDQLSCFVKIDGKFSDSKTKTAWKFPRLIINYALFHQKGIQQCSVDELSLDCRPPCDYKMLRFSNGSFYCEISYPSLTNEKIDILLQDTNQPQMTRISSATNMPVESHIPLTGWPHVMVVHVTILCCGIFGVLAMLTGAAMLITIQRKKNKRRKMNNNIPEIQKLVPCLFLDRASHTIPQPGIVINMGYGKNVTVNNVHGDHGSAVTVRQETKPLVKGTSEQQVTADIHDNSEKNKQ